MKPIKKNTNFILYFIFLAVLIPTIYVYFEHALIEKQAHDKAISETKKIKTLAEYVFFYAIGWSYFIVAGIMLTFPQYRIPYLILIIGTIAIVIFYYLSRIYPIPIPFTDVVIRDMTSDWRDVVTKICQQILVIPVTALLILRNRK